MKQKTRANQKFLSLILATAMTFTLMPVTAWAEGTASYSTQYLENPLFTAASKENVDDFIDTTGDSPYNVVGRFSKIGGAMDPAQFNQPAQQPDSLSADACDESTWYWVNYQMAFNSQELTLAAKGDLGVAYSAYLSANLHNNALAAIFGLSDGHFDDRLSYSVSRLFGFGNTTLHSYDPSSYNKTGNFNMSDNSFVSVGTGSSAGTGLYLHNQSSGCTCESTGVSSMRVMLADTQGPAVTSIYATSVEDADPSAEEDSFHPGDTMYIHLKFDEYIRFADDTVDSAENGMQLDVSLKRTVDNVEETGISATADFVGLSDDTLTFSYTVPQNYTVGDSTRAVNYYLDYIDYSKQSTWLSSDDEAFDLVYVYWPSGGDKTYVTLSAAAVADHMDKTSSLVTDLAGNPVDKAASQKTFDSRTYMDDVAPYVQSVSVYHIEKNAHNSSNGSTEDGMADPGETFMTEGDKIGIDVEFSEEILVNGNSLSSSASSGICAQLNLNDVNGNAIVVTDTNGETVTGVVPTSHVYFEFTVPAGAEPVSDTRLAVSSIYAESGTITDTRDVPYDESAVPPAASEELWLDTAGPELDLALDGNGAFTPLGSDGLIYMPIDLSDAANALSDDFVSGANNVTGYFRWENEYDNSSAVNYPFEYCFGSSSTGNYTSANTGSDISFTEAQVDGMRLYLKIPDAAAVSLMNTRLVFTLYDHAGNKTEMPVPLNYSYDNIGPVITQGTYNTSYDAAAGTGQISADIEIRNVGLTVSGVSYQWARWTGDTQPSADPDAWVSVTAFDAGAGVDSQEIKFGLGLSDLATDDDYHYTLYIKADQDAGEPVTTDFDHDFDLTKPKYVLTLNTDPNEIRTSHSVDFYEPEGVTADCPLGNSIVLVKREGTDDQYWVKTSLMPRDLTLSVFNIPRTTETDVFQLDSTYADWYVCTLEENTAGGMTLTLVEDLANDLIASAERSELSNLFNNHNGELTVRFLSVDPNDLTIADGYYQNPEVASTIVISDNANYTDLSETFRLGTTSYCGNSITISALNEGEDENGQNSYFASEEDSCFGNNLYDLDTMLNGGAPLYFRKAKSVTVDIGEDSLWGWDNVDFTKSCIVFTDYDYTEVTVPLVSKRQTVPVPDGLNDGGNGTINVSVYLYQKLVDSSTGESNSYSTNSRAIFYSTQSLDTYGVSRVERTVTAAGGSFAVGSDYDLSAGSRASEVFLSSDTAAAAGTSVTFTAEYAAFPGAYSFWVYLKVWNSDGDTLTGGTSGWYTMNQISGTDSYSVSIPADELLALAGDGGVLSYQMMLPCLTEQTTVSEDGTLSTASIPYTTSAQTLILRTSGTQPELNVAFTPDTVTDGSVTAAVTEVGTGESGGSAGLTLLYKEAGDTDFLALPRDGLTITDNGEYVFLACDRFLNCGLVTRTVDWIDQTAPVLTASALAADPGQFAFTAEVTEANYKSLTVDIDGTEYAVPEEASGGTWLASTSNSSGIYETSTVISGDVRTVTVYGVFPYDESQGATILHTVAVTAVDEAGLTSETKTLSITAENLSPDYESCVYDSAGGVTATFNLPVVVLDPEESGTASYGTEKSLPIYSDGDYTLQFRDIFGDYYTKDVTVSVYAGTYSINVKLSETSPTNQDVVVTLDATENGSVYLTLPVPDDTMTVEVLETDKENRTTKALVTVTENCSVTFSVVPTTGESAKERTVTVSNIDKTAPTDPQLHWSFSAAVDDVTGETKGDVTVCLTADEELKGDTSHDFTLTDQGDYTFNVTDLAGNALKPVTASLSSLTPAVTVVEKTLKELDTDPPEYSMYVYLTKQDGSLSEEGNVTQTQYETALDSGNPFDNSSLLTREMRLQFKISDVNQTKIVLLSGADASVAGLTYDSAGETVDGVSASGSWIYVTKDAAFTAVIIDANGNSTAVRLTVTRIDTEAPTADITYAAVTFYTERAYVTLSDTEPDSTVEMLTPGISWDAGEGAYYHDFTDNGSYTFTFMDTAGNVGTATAAVSSIDTTAPAVTDVAWSPGDPSSLSIQNKNIVAQLTFDKTLRSVAAVEALDADGNAIGEADYGSYFTVSQGIDDVTVTFLDDVEMTLSFTGLNGRSGTWNADLRGKFDKIAPTVSASSDEPSGYVKSVTITFTSDEAAVNLESGTELTYDGSSEYVYERTVTENGTYTGTFADAAGNTATASCSVTKIDNTAPTLTVTGIPASDAVYTKDPVTVTAKMDEAGTLSFQNKEYAVSAGTEEQFTVSSNGRYVITAEDEAGNLTVKSFTVTCIDTQAPSIVFDKNILRVREGTTAADFETAALSDVTVYDNCDSNPTISLTTTLTDAQLAVPGNYTVTYTAADAVGNEKTATRQVLVYSKDQPLISVNGQWVQDGETVITSLTAEDTVDLEVQMPEQTAGEPYSLYMAKGYYTSGQMKIMGTQLTVVNDAASFTAGPGFYTLCLITQDREFVVVYVYIGN